MHVLGRNTIVYTVLCALTVCVFAAAPAVGGTRILWNENTVVPVVGRTMDAPTPTQPMLTVFPRAMKRNGGKLGLMTVVAENPAVWTSRYGSVVTTMYGAGTADGVNEMGLAIHALYVKETDYGPRDINKRGLHAGLWGQYLLDNAASVEEALDLMEEIQPVMMSMRGQMTTLHLALDDASGDSAIIEYIDGAPVIHHGREHRIMTDAPRYEEQRAFLATNDFAEASSPASVPGTGSPRDRLTRSAYYLERLPEPRSEQEAMAAVLSITRNVSVFIDTAHATTNTLARTEYRTAINLDRPRYYFELTTAPNLMWVDLAKMDLAADMPVTELNPDAAHLGGDISGQFRAARRPPF